MEIAQPEKQFTKQNLIGIYQVHMVTKEAAEQICGQYMFTITNMNGDNVYGNGKFPKQGKWTQDYEFQLKGTISTVNENILNLLFIYNNSGGYAFAELQRDQNNFQNLVGIGGNYENIERNYVYCQKKLP